MQKDELLGITIEELRLLGDQITTSAKSLGLIDKPEPGLRPETYGIVTKGTRSAMRTDKGYHLYCYSRGLYLPHPANPDDSYLGHTKREAYLCLKKILGGLVLAQGSGVRRWHIKNLE